MTFWITITVLIFVLWMLIEESIYYFWNRYCYGPNVERRRKWKNRILWVLNFFKRKQMAEIHEVNKEESSL